MYNCKYCRYNSVVNTVAVNTYSRVITIPAREFIRKQTIFTIFQKTARVPYGESY